MARAAAKRKRGARQAPGEARPQELRRPEPGFEQQLFFGRLRRQAKWAFVFLAVVFAGSFVFLGVGSGNSGLGDVFSSIFSGSSGPSLSSLQKKVAESPRDLTAVSDLASKLQSEGRTEEAIEVLRSFLALEPRNVEALNQLAVLYQGRLQEEATAAQAAFDALQTSIASDLFGLDPASPLGRALAADRNPLSEAIRSDVERRYSEAAARAQAAAQGALDAYRKLADLQPDDPTALFQYAQFADQQAQRPAEAIAAYKRFLQRFPDDSFAPDVRKRLRELEKSQGTRAAAEVPTKSQGKTG
jgi:tetratricopeptide (TPR) repeat protein